MLKNYDHAVTLYLNNCESNDLSSTSIECYSRSFKYYREFLVENDFEDASYVATSMWKSKLSKTVSIVTVDAYLKHLQHLSDFAVKCKLYTDAFMDENLLPPSRKVSKAKNCKEYEHVLTEEDVASLITAETAVFSRTPHTFKREKAVVVLALTSGLRNIELRNLRLKDLNFSESYIFAHVTKGDKPRFVPFVKIAQDCINDYLNSGIRPDSVGIEDCLFGVKTHGGKWRQFERTELSELIYRYEKSIIGPEKASRSHALRHCFASMSLTNGISIEDISQILGHSNISTTNIYSKQLHPEQFASAYGQKFEELRKKEGVA